MDRSFSSGWAAMAVGLLLCLSLLPVAASEPLSPAQVYRTLLPSVFTLEVEDWKGRKTVGSGFLATEAGTGVTAWHLVSEARSVKARFADGEEVEVAGLLGWDETLDLALISLAVEGRPLCRLGTQEVAVGTRAYVIGAPRGYEFAISDGLISQHPCVDGFRQYLVSCPISRGSSGGPVVNVAGEVIGMVAWSHEKAQNLNFATPTVHLGNLTRAEQVIAWSKHLHDARRKLPPGRTAMGGAEVRPGVQGDWTALQDFLGQHAGRDVTVTVQDDDGEATFRVKVPRP